MYKSVKKLINVKFYPNVETIRNIVEVFHTKNRITDEEYEELVALIDDKYSE